MLKVHVGGYDNPLGGLSFYVVDQNEYRKALLHVIDGKTMRFDEVKEGYMAPEPTFSLPLDVGHEFLKAMAELAYERGIRLKTDEVREGKLEATERHLADMRQLVFKHK